MESKLFSAANDEKLIALIRDHPVLYKSSHKNFKNKTIKENVWKGISICLGKSVDDCKTRWRTIRDSYKKNLRKVKFCEGAMIKTKSKYNSEALSFLSENQGKKRRKSNITVEESIDITSMDFSETTENENFEETVTECNTEIYSRLLTDIAIDDQNENDVNLGTTETFRKVFQNQEKEETKDHILQETRKECFTFKDTEESESNHPIHIFFKSMASTVMTFPPELAVETRIRVCNLVSEMELRSLAIKAKAPLPDPITAPKSSSVQKKEVFSKRRKL